MPKIFRLLMVASALVLGAFYFVHWSKTRALNSGEVHVRQQPNDKTKPDTTANASATLPDSQVQPSQPQEVASNSPDDSGVNSSRPQPQNSVATLPASETISRNPQNGIAAVGSGKFELYRQGDLTFRLNTETGQACVLLATDSQWRRPLVYEHGCGNR